MIPITLPDIDKKDIDAVYRSVKNHWGPKCFDDLKNFENNFKLKFGYNYCSATSSCTGAIHLALKSLGIKKNDEIIVPDITWISCATAVTYVGAKPVLVDIDPVNWCIDVKKIEQSITKKTKAIMAVHIYGNVCNLKDLQKICKKYKLLLIEDCAEAIGAKYQNRFVGSFGDASVFSFHGTKLITTGEGGMVVFKKKSYFDTYLKFHNMGLHSSDHRYFFPKFLGLKYKMPNLVAALGNSQLRKTEKLIKKKKFIFNTYKKYLNLKIIKLNENLKNVDPIYWMSTIQIKTKKNIKEKIIKHCLKKKIALRPFFYPISQFKLFKNQRRRNQISYNISKCSVNLPSGNDLNEKKIKYICKVINQYVENEV